MPCTFWEPSECVTTWSCSVKVPVISPVSTPAGKNSVTNVLPSAARKSDGTGAATKKNVPVTAIGVDAEAGWTTTNVAPAARRNVSSRRGVVMVRRREFVAVGAGLEWPVATLAPAATCGRNRPARPSLPARLARWGSWSLGWPACGSPVRDGPAQRASVRRTRRTQFTVTSWWAGLAGRGGGRPSQLTPLLAVAAPFTTRDGPHEDPHNFERPIESR